MNLGAIGLCFDIVGTWFLAYEIVRGYPMRNRADIARSQLHNLQEHVGTMVGHIHEYPDPPFTSDQKLKLIAEMKRKYEPDMREKQEIINLGAHRHWSFLWAVLGAVFLTIGFSLQLQVTLK